MRLKELIKDLRYKRLENVNNCEIKGISCNSNYIQPGYLFVAIKGKRFDGHNFLDQAIARGAEAVIIQRDMPLKKKVTKIIVGDSQKSLASASASFFNRPSKRLKTIGITGTNGKTTVTYLIEKILSCAGYPSGVIGTVNYRLENKVYSALNTTPQADTLQFLLDEFVRNKSKYAIIEVSSHALDQDRIEAINFSSVVFTNLTCEHLDYHRNLNNYFSCKSSLFERLPSQSFAVINIDNAFGRKLIKRIKSQLLTFGIEKPAQIQAKDIRLGSGKTKFTTITPRGKIEIETSLIGRHNVYNILAAISVAFIENIDFSQIVEGVRELTSIPGRLERIDCGQDFLVFVDYAHTEDALKNILQTLRPMCNNRIISVFGCGGDRDKSKRPGMGKVATELSDFVIITSDNPRSEDARQITEDILKGIDKRQKNYRVILDRFSAIKESISMAEKEDIVIVAGKGHESSQIFADKVIPFNDKKVVEEILQCSKSEK